MEYISVTKSQVTLRYSGKEVMRETRGPKLGSTCIFFALKIARVGWRDSKLYFAIIFSKFKILKKMISRCG